MKSTGVSHCVIEKNAKKFNGFYETFTFTAQISCKPLMFLIVFYDNY